GGAGNKCQAGRIDRHRGAHGIIRVHPTSAWALLRTYIDRVDTTRARAEGRRLSQASKPFATSKHTGASMTKACQRQVVSPQHRRRCSTISGEPDSMRVARGHGSILDWCRTSGWYLSPDRRYTRVTP